MNEIISTPPSLWQRLWRSPWTYLVLTIMNLMTFYGVSPHDNMRWFYGALTLYWVAYFAYYANKRWGKP